MNKAEVLKQLKEKKHSNPLKGMKNITSSLELFESPIAEDIDKFSDPDFLEKSQEQDEED